MWIVYLVWLLSTNFLYSSCFVNDVVLIEYAGLSIYPYILYINIPTIHCAAVYIL